MQHLAVEWPFDRSGSGSLLYIFPRKRAGGTHRAQFKQRAARQLSALISQSCGGARPLCEAAPCVSLQPRHGLSSISLTVVARALQHKPYSCSTGSPALPTGHEGSGTHKAKALAWPRRQWIHRGHRQSAQAKAKAAVYSPLTDCPPIQPRRSSCSRRQRCCCGINHNPRRSGPSCWRAVHICCMDHDDWGCGGKRRSAGSRLKPCATFQKVWRLMRQNVL